MEPKEVIAALRAGWWLPLLGLVIGGGAALAISLTQTPLYSSYTQFFVSTRDSTSTTQALQGSQLSQQRVASYAQLVGGEDLAGRVITRLGLDMSPGQLRSGITATAVPETVLVNVTVTDPSPQRAQSIADALGAEFTALVTELETPEAGGSPPVKVTVTDRPELAGAPTSPNTNRNVALGLFVGLLVGAALGVVRARLDRSVKDAEQAAELAGAPVIGHVLRDDVLAKRHIIDRADDSPALENYRQLRNNLQWLSVDQPPTVIMVTSAVAAEGKTTSVLNLALALADAGRRVTVVEADLRQPKVTEYLGMVGGVGLTNVLAGTADVADVAQRYDDRDLWVIAAGPTPPNPGELLASSHMLSLVDKLRGDNDFVLVDAPPVLPVADTSGLAAYMDGVLLVVRHGRTRKDQLGQAAAALERVRARLLGLIITMVPVKGEMAEAHGYGYGTR